MHVLFYKRACLRLSVCERRVKITCVRNVRLTFLTFLFFKQSNRPQQPGTIITSCEREFDVIFMDFHMPGMCGNDAAKKIREIEKYEQRQANNVACVRVRVLWRVYVGVSAFECARGRARVRVLLLVRLRVHVCVRMRMRFCAYLCGSPCVHVRVCVCVGVHTMLTLSLINLLI